MDKGNRLTDNRKVRLSIMKRKLMQFMQGRYGVDQFGRALFKVIMVFLIISILTRANGFSVLAFILLIYAYFRIFSRNHLKRAMENRRYLDLTADVRGKFFLWKRAQAQKKMHHIYRCPGCKQKIRVPRGKGRIVITCPKCRTEFIKNS